MLFWTVSKKLLRFRDPFYMMRSKQLRTCTRIHCLLFISVGHVPFNRGLFDPNGCDPTKPFSIVSCFQKELLKFQFLKTHTPNRVRQGPKRSNLSLIETRAMKSTGNYANHFVFSLCPSQKSVPS